MAQPCKVEEFYISLTPAATRCQDSLQILMNENITEIKRATQQLHTADLRSLCMDDVLLQVTAV